MALDEGVQPCSSTSSCNDINSGTSQYSQELGQCHCESLLFAVQVPAGGGVQVSSAGEAADIPAHGHSSG